MTLKLVRQTFLTMSLVSWSEVTAKASEAQLHGTCTGPPQGAGGMGGAGIVSYLRTSRMPGRALITEMRVASRIERGCGQNFLPPTNHVPVSVLSKYEAAPSNIF